jgi:hypothetical protein
MHRPRGTLPERGDTGSREIVNVLLLLLVVLGRLWRSWADVRRPAIAWQWRDNLEI